VLNLAQERLVAGTAVATPDLLVLGGLLFGVVSTASVAIVLTARRVRRRTLGLPKRVETMIFDRNPIETSSGFATQSDPIELAAAEFWTMAQKLRARLSENEKIERMAFTDPLTGLPNRRGLLAFLDMLAERTEDSGDDSKMGLVHIDLDHFKTINDTMGHDAGDTVLREATKRMSTAIRDSDLLARLGGDEFLVVATGIEHEGDLTRIADRLTDQFKSPIMYRERVCHVGVSMGLVLGGQRGRVRDPKRLLINADMALFRAKSQGRGQYAIFTSAMADEARQRNERSIALGKALQDDAFRPWFQPMLDLKDQSVTGLELLCRWHDEERGLVMPDGFIEDAEANSLMEEIGLRVLEHAISALQEWRLSGATVPTIHLNLSRTQLLSSSFVDRLSWTLDEANLPPGQFAIEIDERDCSERGSEVVFANTRRMRNLGLKAVLDNFGAEQANLTILARLGARMVKCNAAMFERLLRDQSASEKVHSLAALENAADAFGILTGAKGVETLEQSDLLMAAGIHVQQGDFLSRVLNAEDTGRFLRGELDGVHVATQRAS
ncbi:MAG: EAL domain-containing protein, partial [Pseudomonadota bacterium]